MYKFTRTDEGAFRTLSRVQTVVDGHNLDVNLRGFRTLAVHGRETLARVVQVHEKANYSPSLAPIYDGGIYLGSNYSTRAIRVEYEVDLKDWTDHRGLYEALNALTHKPQIWLVFTDDPGFFWIGTLTAMDEIETALNHKGAMEFLCTDPYKHSLETHEMTFDSKGVFNRLVHHPVRLEQAIITPKNRASKIIITNDTRGQRIILDGDFVAHNPVIIDFKRARVYLGQHRRDITSWLDIRSDFEDFTILTNDVVRTSVPCRVNISYRERRL